MGSDQQFPHSFNFKSRQDLLDTRPPVTLQLFLPRSGPIRNLTVSDRDRGHRCNRHPDKGTQDNINNSLSAPAEEEDDTEIPTPTFHLGAETYENVKGESRHTRESSQKLGSSNHSLYSTFHDGTQTISPMSSTIASSTIGIDLST